MAVWDDGAKRDCMTMRRRRRVMALTGFWMLRAPKENRGAAPEAVFFTADFILRPSADGTKRCRGVVKEKSTGVAVFIDSAIP